MELEKQKKPVVRIQISGAEQKSRTVSVYETTVEEVKELITKTIKNK